MFCNAFMATSAGALLTSVIMIFLFLLCLLCFEAQASRPSVIPTRLYMDMHGAIVPLLDDFSASAVLQSYSCTPFSEMHCKSRQNLAMARNGLHECRVWLHEGEMP